MEKLIEYVRDYEELYNLAHLQYLNGNYKNKKWAEISKKLEQPGMLNNNQFIIIIISDSTLKSTVM